MNSIRGNRYQLLSIDDDVMDMSSLSLAQDRKNMKSARKPSSLIAMKKMPPKPPKATRLFQPKLENTGFSLVASRKPKDGKDARDGREVMVEGGVLEEPEPVPEPGQRPGRGPASGRSGTMRSGGRNDRGARIFDRQSGSDRTGVKAVVKRNGGGAHNWGSPKQDIEMRNRAEWRPTNRTKSTSAVSTQSKSVDKEDSVEEPKQITLDEWRAMRASGQKKKPLEEKGLEKQSQSADGAAEGPGGADVAGRRSGRHMRLVDIQFNFYDERRTRSSKQRPILKISQDPEFCPKVDDEKQFPNLS
ncbi:plasminogen activator inhibitor 1 RNA-binding protein [Drosophila rhopaloa]|uniref:Plasminogen activator inhibitor 1 RNA-binding protein n=1 Tax=Drosophila rhopaloa TaxID=1041015 RepID=A0A6P4EA92_DRORH|nr:plasminogen activator inhibitor 1 RNA-binding protein [Drosophila rhopaloa]